MIIKQLRNFDVQFKFPNDSERAFARKNMLQLIIMEIHRRQGLFKVSRSPVSQFPRYSTCRVIRIFTRKCTFVLYSS